MSVYIGNLPDEQVTIEVDPASGVLSIHFGICAAQQIDAAMNAANIAFASDHARVSHWRDAGYRLRPARLVRVLEAVRSGALMPAAVVFNGLPIRPVDKAPLPEEIDNSDAAGLPENLPTGPRARRPAGRPLARVRCLLAFGEDRAIGSAIGDVERLIHEQWHPRKWVEMGSGTPTGHVGARSEIAAVAAFLASWDGTFMTGSEVFADMGSRGFERNDAAGAPHSPRERRQFPAQSRAPEQWA